MSTEAADVTSHLSRLSFLDAARTRAPVRRRIRSRGVPNALQGHLVAQSDMPGEATKFISMLLGRTTISVDTGHADGFHATLHGIQTHDVAMAHLDLAAPCTLDVAQSAEAFTVHMTTVGQAAVSIGEVRHAITPFFALVVSPGMRYQLHLELDSPQLIIRVERAAMEQQLSRMLGRALAAPIVFEPIGDLTVDAAVRWHGAIQILSSEVLSPGSLLRRGTGTEALGELLISTLLYIQKHNYSSGLHRPAASGRPAVRRSVDYIAEHLAERITLEALSDYAGMSVRTIQSGFQQDLGTTPVAYIREQRLLKVRADLQRAVPGDGLTVTESAERWGFSHLGNFSILYRKRFGESPSTTLKR
ncbi:MAG: AraC family transcriptional regulator [Gordonia sp.]|jgi:AraC-like DNA-binding protein|uniref:helix-turn-helix transcriptional regulator n=1 Tax=Gordonia sp. (in: high G+C Gram-positive bacteria) TaxID=84139 RepID=UPI001D5D315A|nr:AraC family transcriptional regulator [Gordonia sp. (in: high G+C Gram-positive bacteria)]MCB1293292.1 AraC family transcriptional regulator [Gordonia sp. (in: high G+C Gram-positive bacteria)]HQV19372.1 AraC family transcriptional regulator [Gordonia sp. (in: high G+C Gram-positive bacteria)]